MIDHNICDDIDNHPTIKCHETESLEECKDLNFIKSTNNFKIISYNIRSINKNLDDFIVSLRRLETNFDAIILTECWLQTSLVGMIPGYFSHQTHNYINKSSGVVVYIKENWNVKVEELKLKEAEGIQIDFPNNVTLIAVYRSPSFQNTNTFMFSLNSVMNNLKNKNNLIFAGDININILDSPTQNTDYLCLLGEHGLTPAITKATHFKTCIDHIFLRSNFEANSVVCNLSVTDHDLIILCLEKKINNNKNEARKRCNYTEIKSDLEHVDWSQLYLTDDINTAASHFNNTICNILQNNTTLIKYHNSKHIIKPWITPGLLRCLKHRDKLHIQLRKNTHDPIKKNIYLFPLQKFL